MSPRRRRISLTRIVASGAAIAAGTYAAYVATTWLRFGGASASRDADEADDLLDRFMPDYDVVERHHIAVDAPAGITLEVARSLDVNGAPVVRAVFKARELLMGSTDPAPEPSNGLVEDMRALGWGVLAEHAGREIVMGAVTRPWEANPVFRTLEPDAFLSFDEPDYVKIAWTLRADPVDDTASIFRTETRAMATDDGAYEKFRLYWSLLSPGIVLIRWAMLSPLKADAERLARAAIAR
jgi:hypothetical protein